VVMQQFGYNRPEVNLIHTVLERTIGLNSTSDEFKTSAHNIYISDGVYMWLFYLFVIAVLYSYKRQMKCF
jgi:surface polysaccharide O-acyltransferase-like enzyme